MPGAVRAYARVTTRVNLIEWDGADGFELGDALAALADLDVTVVVGDPSLTPASSRSLARRTS